jgi:hypothetical protein
MDINERLKLLFGEDTSVNYSNVEIVEEAADDHVVVVAKTPIYCGIFSNTNVVVK